MNLFRILIAATLVFSFGLSAMPGDSYQSIIVESDVAERSEKTGLTQYTGNVTIRQGSMVIDANQVTVHYKNNKVSRILCTGNPASYQQSNKLGSRVLARAETLEYMPAEELINLTTDASLSRNGTLITGNSISYNLEDGTWSAKGDNQSKQKRIQLVIPPSQQAAASKTVQPSASTQKESDSQ
ncbi:MAG: lipopolysaccharide transport periplasmic protein LptA [Porticoccaceae bacterium]|nr:lipopolysaccharide transport periplasmic protein LptA [Porticoccaceae bacterium]